MPAAFYARIANKVYGPLDGAKLKRLAAAGTLSRSDSISKDGKTGWTSAGAVAGLFPPPVAPTPPPTVTPPPPPVPAPPAQRRRNPLAAALAWLRAHPWLCALWAFVACLGFAGPFMPSGGKVALAQVTFALIAIVVAIGAVVALYYGLFWFIGRAVSAGWQASRPQASRQCPHCGRDLGG